MFNSKSKSSGCEISGGSTTIIGAGTIIKGNIESSGDIRIDGTLVGNLSSKSKILVGADGTIDGSIKGKNADVLGKVTGQIDVKEVLQLRGKCVVDGDICTGKLEVEPTATFNGRCQMGASVIELTNIVGLNVELATAVNQ